LESVLVRALELEYQPVAVSLSDEAPPGTRTPRKGRTCVMRFPADGRLNGKRNRRAASVPSGGRLLERMTTTPPMPSRPSVGYLTI